MGNSKSNVHGKSYNLKCLHIKKERMKFRKVNIHLKKCETVKPTQTEEEQRINLKQSESNGLENKTK